MTDSEKIAQLEKKVEILQAQIIVLFKELGISPPYASAPPASPEIIALVKNGDIKAAIQAYRDQTGVNLKDAKKYIESIVS